MDSLFLGIGIAALCLLAVFAPRFFRANQPVRSAQAQVISRKGKLADGSYSNFRGSRMQYTVTFRTAEETMELQANSSQYVRLVEDTCGKLAWKGNTLLSFEADE